MHTLSATKRDAASGTPRALLTAGKLAAVVYGPKQPSTPIALDAREFEKVLRSAGESSVISLTGLGEPLQVLVHEIERDPVKHTPRHIDLYAIEKGAKVEVEVPLEFVNESPAVKAGANLVKVMHELPIKADAAHLPQSIPVDVSVLAAIGDQIRVSDLVIPAGVTVEVDGEEVVALIQEVVEEKEEAAPAADLGAIEVEKKGKEEDADAGGEAKE